ncbi:hypothetical protein IWX91DRAFT_19431 [Phyllosticta citricarpa]
MWHGCGQRPRYLSIPSRPSHHGKVIIQTTQHNTTPITAAAIVCNSLTFFIFFFLPFFPAWFRKRVYVSTFPRYAIQCHYIYRIACVYRTPSCHDLALPYIVVLLLPSSLPPVRRKKGGNLSLDVMKKAEKKKKKKIKEKEESATRPPIHLTSPHQRQNSRHDGDDER